MAQQPQDVDQAAVLAALDEDQPPQQQAAAAADPLVEDNNVSCVIPFRFSSCPNFFRQPLNQPWAFPAPRCGCKKFETFL